MTDRLIPNTAAPRPGESQADCRKRIALLEAEALERRQQELSEQCSPSKTAADRIRIWERRHQLTLPNSPGHRLVTVIAINTGLSLDEVRAEQLVRTASKATTSAG